SAAYCIRLDPCFIVHACSQHFFRLYPCPCSLRCSDSFRSQLQYLCCYAAEDGIGLIAHGDMNLTTRGLNHFIDTPI
ncbi:uncharacterized protein EI90DRAFT_3041430, partial [Cantharellus anzutake]|uniref:uncharacterized protein n=1 Tax=Cantharellus anzutake TaxID=1750568 RepID=UPI001907436E